VTLDEAAASLRENGSVLRVGDVVRVMRHDDLFLLSGPQGSGGRSSRWGWPGFYLPSGEPPFAYTVPGDFAELAAHEGRIVYPADPWSSWPEEALAASSSV
jgi:hypothetical protein